MIMGLVLFCVIIIQLLLAVKLGRVSLWPLTCVQTILIVLLSTEDTSQDVVDFATPLLMYKLDFGFLSPDLLNNELGCEHSSIIMQNAHFYCQSTFLNYM
mmetsp:Transcript_1685/g.2112  ORF Transcript_1685/g.2112 Transcript_1685/m.2112 type:complete len:100 (-) Transcript_1685:338-637(-)